MADPETDREFEVLGEPPPLPPDRWALLLNTAVDAEPMDASHLLPADSEAENRAQDLDQETVVEESDVEDPASPIEYGGPGPTDTQPHPAADSPGEDSLDTGNAAPWG